MLLLLAVVTAAGLLIAVTGGRMTNLAAVEWRAAWLLLAAAAIQLAIPLAVPAEAAATRAVLHPLSYVVAGAFVVANRRVAGVVAVASGGALNLAAILANGGVMPASAGALAAAGLAPGGLHNSAFVADAQFALLGDVLAVSWPAPLATVFSVGDVVIVAGAVYGLRAVCGGRPLRATAAAMLRRRPASERRVERRRPPAVG